MFNGLMDTSVGALIIASFLPAFCFGQELAGPGPEVAIRTSDQKECDRRYRDNNCTEFFKTHPEVAVHAINCNEPVNPAEELKKCGSGSLQVAEQTMQLISTAYAVLMGLPTTVANARAKRDEQLSRVWGECVKSLDCKVAAYTSARGQEPSLSTRDFLNKLNEPAKLEGLLFHASSAKLTDKRRQAVEILRTMPDSAERDSKMDALYPGWSGRKHAAANSIWEVGRSSSHYLLKADACFSREVQMEMVCHGLTSLVLPGAAIKSGSKLFQITRALGSEVRAGNAVQALSVPKRILDIHPTVRKWLDSKKPSSWANSQISDLGTKFSIKGKSYEIERVLGNGGEGVVALARSEDGLVVVKRFHTEKAFRAYERYQKKLSDLIPEKKASDASTRTVVMQYREGIPVDEIFSNGRELGLSSAERAMIEKKWDSWSKKHSEASKRYWNSNLRQIIQTEPPRVHTINVVYSPRDGNFYFIDPY